MSPSPHDNTVSGAEALARPSGQALAVPAKPEDGLGASRFDPSRDGWIEWFGGECPVSLHTMVDVRFRDGGWQDATGAGYWAGFLPSHNLWVHTGSRSDIIAYRVVQS